MEAMFRAGTLVTIFVVIWTGVGAERDGFSAHGKGRKEKDTNVLIKQALEYYHKEVWGGASEKLVKNMYKQFSDLVDLTNKLTSRIVDLEKALAAKCGSEKKGDNGKQQKLVLSSTSDSLAVKSSTEMKKPLGPESSTGDDDKSCRRGPKGQKGAKGEPGPSLEAPELLTKSQLVWVKQGETIRLKCVAKGYPRPTVILTNSSSMQIREEKSAKEVILYSLKLKASLEDAKRYHCRAKSVLGEVDIVFDVRVKVAPRIRLDSKISMSRVSASIELPMCSVIAIPSAKVTWSRAYGGLPMDVYFKNGNQTLGIHNVNFEDSGFYLCEAQNELGKDKAAVQLIVTTTTFRMFQKPPSTVVFKPSLNLTCGAKGYPRPTIKWYYRDSEVSKVSYWIPSADAVVASISVNTTGKFMCVASSGGEKISSHVNVRDTLFPSNILSRKKNLESQLLSWLKETKELSRNWRLCYSSYGNFSGQELVRSCGRYNKTVILIQVGYSIFGGFSDVSWSPTSYYGTYGSSNESFLFTLRKRGISPMQFTVRPYKNEYAVFRSLYQPFGFGAGPDLRLPTRKGGIITSNLGNTYESPYGACCVKDWFFNQRDYASHLLRVEVLYAVEA